MVTYASQKAGTNPATRQKESDFGADFTLSTACSAATCVATVVSGPAPSNRRFRSPRATHGTGRSGTPSTTGSGIVSWVTRRKKWSPAATSWAFYAPQPDGSLRGPGRPTSPRAPAAAYGHNAGGRLPGSLRLSHPPLREHAEERQIGRPLGKSADEVPIPLSTEWNVDAHVVALGIQAALPGVTDAVQHLIFN